MADYDDQTWIDSSDRWSEHSRQSSAYSEISGRSHDKENHVYQNKLSSYPTIDDNSSVGGTELILMRGGELLEESRTEPLVSDTQAL